MLAFAVCITINKRIINALIKLLLINIRVNFTHKHFYALIIGRKPQTGHDLGGDVTHCASMIYKSWNIMTVLGDDLEIVEFPAATLTLLVKREFAAVITFGRQMIKCSLNYPISREEYLLIVFRNMNLSSWLIACSY